MTPSAHVVPATAVRMGKAMKFYSSFLIRCWLIENAQRGEKKIIDVEHIQRGGHTRVAIV